MKTWNDEPPTTPGIPPVPSRLPEHELQRRALRRLYRELRQARMEMDDFKQAGPLSEGYWMGIKCGERMLGDTLVRLGIIATYDELDDGAKP